MIIKTLVENTSLSEDFKSEHGLSLYIEAINHKILFDVGASGLFLENAHKMDVDIADVDFLIISHGHYDHGGGLKIFLKENNKAEVFLHQQAFDKHYALRRHGKLEPIGLRDELKRNKQMRFTLDRLLISKGVQVFANIVQREPRPTSNYGLFTVHCEKMVDDTFTHEQNLIVEEDGKILLVTGCAHNGIINILEHFQAIKGRKPDYVIGGFHLSSPIYGNECSETIDKIGKYLLDTKAKCFTCHCTGIEPYQQLKAVMGANIDYLSTGSVIEL
jgi:7,8-dihydropterin-6-yl-methyl-4-(beta-D-ribofuranosyl)aminobenzene 5'-phosphate synthase